MGNGYLQSKLPNRHYPFPTFPHSGPSRRLCLLASHHSVLDNIYKRAYTDNACLCLPLPAPPQPQPLSTASAVGQVMFTHP
ncbi:hypothetical protein PoB_007247400, partial [Plakobranchus ocellatus]